MPTDKDDTWTSHESWEGDGMDCRNAREDDGRTLPPVLKKTTWAVVEGGQAAVCQVAARTLRHRLDTVWAEARAAVIDRRSPERVHRLRVATRRTLAAFEAFADLMPSRQRLWFQRRLRELRRAAGDARDLDVLTARLAQRPGLAARRLSSQGARAAEGALDGTRGGERARSRLIAMLAKQQDAARLPIRDVFDRVLAADWTRRVDRLIGRITDDGCRAPFGPYARRRLKPLVLRFFATADRRLRSAEELHDLRIEGKKLRYALEIFAGALPPVVRERCEESLARLQETLGEFTDHAAAADRFRRWSRDASMAADRSVLRMLRRQESALADAARRRFARWWNPERRRDLRRTFERSLRRHPA
jgi:CHAD domain-containing protein